MIFPSDKLLLRIEELAKKLHSLGFYSDGKGGGVYPACWDEDDGDWSALPDLNRSPVLLSRFCYSGRCHFAVWRIFAEGELELPGNYSPCLRGWNNEHRFGKFFLGKTYYLEVNMVNHTR